MLQVRGVNGPINGKFRVAAVTGLTAGIAAGGCIFSFQFAPPNTNTRCLITDLRLKAQIITPFTAANEITCSSYIARSWSGADSGGTALSLTGLYNNISSCDPSYTSYAAIRAASASAITVGTRTVDANPFMALPASQPGSSLSAQAYFETDLPNVDDQRFGINLSQNEGIVVTLQAAQGAGGTVRYSTEIEWMEYVTNSVGVYGG